VIAKYNEGTIGNGCYLKYVEEDNRRTLKELDQIEKNTEFVTERVDLHDA
jgi:hypothetical protein